jgi:cytochrome c peroxidase
MRLAKNPLESGTLEDVMSLRQSLILVGLAATLSACGGGGSASSGGGTGSSSSGGATGSSSSSGGTTNPPTVNRAPTVNLAIPDQTAIQGHPFDFDFTQGGKTFTDPDGDPITYSAQLYIGGIQGLRVEGTHILGTPTEAVGFVEISVDGNDGRGGANNTHVVIRLNANHAPARATSYADVLVNVGQTLNVDVAAPGAAFTDADGDPVTYQLGLRGMPGLSVAGTQVTGALASIGATEVMVTARDGFGGETVETFMVAAPAPASGAPALPATSYVYEDAQLPFRYVLTFPYALYPFDSSPNVPTNAGATLGRVLFHDKRLSITNTIACASCHQQSHGFASPNRFDTGVLGTPIKRNTMTLTNGRMGLQQDFGFFSDVRVERLRDAARSALEAHDELGSSLPDVVTKLRAAGFYEPLFNAAFGSPDITDDRVLLALEQYVRTILSYRTRFDQVCLPMDNSPVGCETGFTAQELRGQQIFEGAAQVPCALCHNRWNFHNDWHANNGIDDVVTDPGATNPAIQRDGSQGVFRAGSLRNIARTAPYMHDGRFAALRDVINHYDHGIKQSRDLDALLKTSTGEVRRMDLSEEDKDALEAFLNTLTDDEMLTDPKFSNPFQ